MSIYQAGQLVLGREKLRQQPRNDRELTEVDLDVLEPPWTSWYMPSHSKAMPAKVSVTVYCTGTKDITDQRRRDRMDDATLSNYASTLIVQMDMQWLRGFPI